MADEYTVKVYVDHGYFEYTVADQETALQHAMTIAKSRVFRHCTGDNEVVFYHVDKVKVNGPDLQTKYPSTFCRT